MAFLRRICYVYYYEGTQKSGNVGFVRIQAQNGVTKLFMNIKLPADIQTERLKLYLAGEGMPDFRILIGSIKLAGRECSFRTVISAEDAAGGGRPLADYDGILAYDENGYSPLLGASFMEKELPESFFAPNAFEMPENAEKMIENAEKDAKVTDVEKTVTDSAEENLVPDKGMAETGKEGVVKGATGKGESVMEETGKGESVKEEAAITEMSIEEIALRKAEPSAQWMRMTRNMGKLCVLEQGQCVAIRPFQMSRLPGKYWELSRNSYVLHGYYVYGHLILVRTEDEEGKEQIWLGVPGGNGEKEEKEAKMYGFPHYKKRIVRRQSGMPEGYWCRLLK